MVFVRDVGDVGNLLYFAEPSSFTTFLDTKYAASEYYLHDGRKIVSKHHSFGNDQEIRLCLRLPGGKGGFGSNLRAQGNRLSSKKRAGNYESCRDLATGLRLRDLQRARVVKEFEEVGGGEGVRRRKEREYKERVLKRVQVEEQKMRRVDAKDTVAIERAHREAAKIEHVATAALELEASAARDKGKQIVCGWEDDLEHF